MNTTLTVNESRAVGLTQAIELACEAITDTAAGHTRAAHRAVFSSASVIVKVLEGFEERKKQTAPPQENDSDLAARALDRLKKAAKSPGSDAAAPIAALTLAVGLMSAALRSDINRNPKDAGQCVAWAFEAVASAYAIIGMVR